MATPNIPDKVVFGPDKKGNPLTYGQLRKLPVQEQVEALHRRHEDWLIKQTQPLADSGFSPFPLAVMTCVGMEALGLIAFGSNGQQFQHVATAMDHRFGLPLSQKFKTSLMARWPLDPADRADASAMSTAGDVLYTFFRNSMVHGYRGRVVTLSHDETTDLTFDDNDGILIVDPWWMWKRYVDVVNVMFTEIESSTPTSNAKRRNAENHIQKMLK